MAYDKQDWKNGTDGGTPLSAERLNHIETGIAEKASRGQKGEPGAQGPAGADGAPSEEEWNALLDRVTALEGE